MMLCPWHASGRNVWALTAVNSVFAGCFRFRWWQKGVTERLGIGSKTVHPARSREAFQRKIEIPSDLNGVHDYVKVSENHVPPTVSSWHCGLYQGCQRSGWGVEVIRWYTNILFLVHVTVSRSFWVRHIFTYFQYVDVCSWARWDLSRWMCIGSCHALGMERVHRQYLILIRYYGTIAPIILVKVLDSINRWAFFLGGT